MDISIDDHDDESVLKRDWTREREERRGEWAI